MDKKSSKPSMSRRAVLQGSLAAPVVLTVSPASAAMNSAGRALRNMKNYQPTKSQYFKDSPDNWFRQSVPVVKLAYKGKDDKTKNPGKEDWFYLDPDKNHYIKLSTMQWMSFGAILPEGWEEKDRSTRYLLVWLDPDTGAQSLRMQVEPRGNEIAAHCSAAASVIPAAAQNCRRRA